MWLSSGSIDLKLGVHDTYDCDILKMTSLKVQNLPVWVKTGVLKTELFHCSNGRQRNADYWKFQMGTDALQPLEVD